MPHRHLPVRPNLDQLKHQAKDLLRLIQRGDPSALAEVAEFHPSPPSTFKLADAQFVLARSYYAASWPRLVLACQVVDAIWRDDVAAVRRIVTLHPALVHEDALVREGSNWGPPMSYAANLGRDEIIEMLHGLGATDLEHAIGRAVLQGKVETARILYKKLGSPVPPPDALGGAAYTLSSSGTALMLELGARVVGERGERLAPVGVVLESDSRKPSEKHAILEMYVSHGLTLPDTAPMAVHRGRIDLLEEHLRRDPLLLSRRFSFEEIYPHSMGCIDEVSATYGTPLAGATLMHLCVDYDEMEIALWLLSKGFDVNTPALVDSEGFGGHTALFSTVVSQPTFWMHHQGLPVVAPFTELLLAHGADVNVRASLRKELHPGYDAPGLGVYRDVTPVSWGERFVHKKFVNETALAHLMK